MNKTTRTTCLASLALMTLTGCSGAPAPDGSADVHVLVPSLGTESWNPPPPSYGYFDIQLSPSVVLDIEGGGEYGHLQLYTPNGGQNQMFGWGSTHSLRGLAGACIEVPSGGSAPDGTQLYVFPCNGASYQAWYFEKASLTTMGKCVDLRGAQYTNGTPVQVYDCLGQYNQRFWLENDYSLPVSPDSFTIETAGDGTCLEAEYNGLVDVFQCESSAQQSWVRGSNGSLVNMATCYCLSAATPNDGTQLTVTPCNGSPNQQFTITGEIHSGYDGRCMDVRGLSTSPGTAVQIYTCNGGGNQIFSMYE
jgi:Ricin-type beta-trefoil lectin domain